MKDPHKKSKAELHSELGWLPERFIDRLLGLQIRSLTMELVEELKKKVEALKSEISALEVSTEKELYETDLKAL